MLTTSLNIYIFNLYLDVKLNLLNFLRPYLLLGENYVRYKRLRIRKNFFEVRQW